MTRRYDAKKFTIAHLRATAEKCKNWGRWGPDDQVGTLNFVTPQDMLAELRHDNTALVAHMRGTHELCDDLGDVATASLLEVWIDEAERRSWFLYEASARYEPRK